MAADLLVIAKAAGQVKNIVNAAQSALLAWRNLGRERDELLALLDQVEEEEGRDITDAEFAEFVDEAQDALARLRADTPEARTPRLQAEIDQEEAVAAALEESEVNDMMSSDGDETEPAPV